MHKTFHEQLRPDPDSYVDLKVRSATLRFALLRHNCGHDRYRCHSPPPLPPPSPQDNSAAHEFYGNVTSMHFGLDASAHEKESFATGRDRQEAEAEREAYRRKFHTRATAVTGPRMI